MTVPCSLRGFVSFLLLAVLGLAMPALGQESTKDAKVIYGADDRIDVYQETDPDQLARVRATCGLVSVTDLTDNGDGTYTIGTQSFSVSYAVCPEEPFSSQPIAMNCTGFMVGSRRITTAGHCLDESTKNDYAMVFGFEMLDASTPVTTVNADQVYFPTTIISQANDGVLDYCVVDVDRDITSPGAFALPLRTEGTVELGQPVGVIGHPAGLPMKIAFGASTVVTVNDGSTYFEANLDTYGGNSGSPVFNQTTGLVEGILVYGATDFVTEGLCRVSNELDDSAGSEGVTRTSVFAAFVNGSEGEGTAEGEGEGLLEGEGVAEGEGLLEGEGVAEGEGLLEGEGVAEGEGEGLLEGEGITEGEGLLEGEGVAEGEGEGLLEGEVNESYAVLLANFAAAESNGDRLLTLAEAQAQVPGFTQQNLDEADANGDGQLSVAELLEYLGGGILTSADTSGDSIVQLTELLRLIQLYNAGLYACAENAGATEDGFSPSATLNEPDCVLHSVDQNGDKVISLSELLRGIQLFNFAGYSYCDGQSEDNFCDRP